MNLKTKSGKKRHKLSLNYNKSSNCINPEYFNPLINYKNKDEKKKIIRRNYISNKDHFDNMTPTQIYKYKPHIKKSKYNYYSLSQIDSLPGKILSRIEKIPIKRSGKKIFKKFYLEESKENIGRNNNNLKNKTIINVNNNKNKAKVYEFDNPMICHRDMKIK